jgi:5-methylcytosine-specific restriction endonuclease McrA
MFSFCTERLHLSEHEAYLRIEVARASRKHPALLEMLADGRLHLSGIALLHKHLTEENRDTVLEKAAHKTKREIEEVIAELSPKPDVPPTVRKRPQRQAKANKKRTLLGPDLVEAQTATPAIPPAPPPAEPASVKPLAPARYKVEFTASAELRDKLERLTALMPNADIATIIEEAVTEKLERLEAKRYGKTKTPRKSVDETDTSPTSRYIPAPVRREVYERDAGQCTYIDPTGRRCTETKHLEFHHIQPYGQGGCHSPENVVLLCGSHNKFMAERDYGKGVMNRYRNSPDRVLESSAVYTFSNRDTRAHRQLTRG